MSLSTFWENKLENKLKTYGLDVCFQLYVMIKWFKKKLVAQQEHMSISINLLSLYWNSCCKLHLSQLLMKICSEFSFIHCVKMLQQNEILHKRFVEYKQFNFLNRKTNINKHEIKGTFTTLNSHPLTKLVSASCICQHIQNRWNCCIYILVAVGDPLNKQP